MSARLFCKTGKFAGSDFSIESEANIGRGQTNTITLKSSRISTYHARITFDANTGRYTLVDLKSRNGTKVDGIQVERPELLGDLNVITLADAFDFIFQANALEKSTRGTAKIPIIPPVEEKTVFEDDIIAPPSSAPSQPTPPPTPSAPADSDRTVFEDDMIAPPPAAPAASNEVSAEQTMMEDDIIAPPPSAPLKTPPPAPAAPTKPQTYALSVSESGGSFKLSEGEQIIGRSEAADIRIQHASISRRHAAIAVTGSGVTINDLGSKNGTTVGGQKVSAPTPIDTDSSVRIGDVDVRLVTR